MPIDELQVIVFQLLQFLKLLLITVSALIFRLVFNLVCQFYQLHIDEQEKANHEEIPDILQHAAENEDLPYPVQDSLQCVDNEDLPYPVQDTQEPGIHPSMAFNGPLEELRKRISAEQANFEQDKKEKEAPDNKKAAEEHLKAPEQGRGTDESVEQREAPEQGREIEESVEQGEAPGQGREIDVLKGKETSQEEHGEQPSSEPQSSEFLPVPRDVDHSNPATEKPPEAADEQTFCSDEQPSASGSNATAYAPSANPDKKRKRKRKKNKKNKKVLAEGSADSSDGETSSSCSEVEGKFKEV